MPVREFCTSTCGGEERRGKAEATVVKHCVLFSATKGVCFSPNRRGHQWAAACMSLPACPALPCPTHPMLHLCPYFSFTQRNPSPIFAPPTHNGRLLTSWLCSCSFRRRTCRGGQAGMRWGGASREARRGGDMVVMRAQGWEVRGDGWKQQGWWQEAAGVAGSSSSPGGALPRRWPTRRCQKGARPPAPPPSQPALPGGRLEPWGGGGQGGGWVYVGALAMCVQGQAWCRGAVSAASSNSPARLRPSSGPTAASTTPTPVIPHGACHPASCPCMVPSSTRMPFSLLTSRRKRCGIQQHQIKTKAKLSRKAPHCAQQHLDALPPEVGGRVLRQLPVKGACCGVHREGGGGGGGGCVHTCGARCGCG